MVKALHAANIEVILDVVYNHTAEGNHMGSNPLFPRHRQSLSYYRLGSTGSSALLRHDGHGNSSS